ncbi:hypothetical protein, partial [Escherichia coli]|uniref:hypothetical protein n=1 Tax=Escherichia coli TaxID=562 RepID=UPI0023F7C7EB
MIPGNNKLLIDVSVSMPAAIALDIILPHMSKSIFTGTVAKLAMRQPFVLFKGLTFQKLCL